jgi:hypothetical protein
MSCLLRRYTASPIFAQTSCFCAFMGSPSSSISIPAAGAGEKIPSDRFSSP